MNSPAANPVIHLELHTGDLQGAVSFYAQLFGWQPERIRAGAGSYLALGMGDRVGGGVVECAAKQPLWLPYVEVPRRGRDHRSGEGSRRRGPARPARGAGGLAQRRRGSRTAARSPSGRRRTALAGRNSPTAAPRRISGVVTARRTMEREPVSAPVRGELRYWTELARLLADPRFHRVAPGHDPRPVLLIPGFLAGDASLTALAGWLRRRGHRVRGSGMRINVGCAGRELTRLEGEARRVRPAADRDRAEPRRDPGARSGRRPSGVRHRLGHARLACPRSTGRLALGAAHRPLLRPPRRPRGAGCLLERLPGRRLLRRVPVPARSPARPGPADPGRLLPQRRDRGLAGVPRSRRAAASRSTEAIAGWRSTPASTESSRTCSSGRRRPHPGDERPGCDVPARRERRHPDAHRRRQHLRGPAASVRRSCGRWSRASST